MERSYSPIEEGTQDSPRRSERRQDRRNSGSQPSRDEVRAVLQSVLEHDLIPRLMNAHRTQPLPPAAPAKGAAVGVPVAAAHVQTVVDLSLHGEASKLREYVDRLRDEGVSIESIYLDLLTPAARQIGAMWEADTCDFVLVTLGLLRIQQALCDLSPDFVQEGQAPSSRRVMVLPVPGSHHTFGAAMVSDFFRREGWDVVGSHEIGRTEVLRLVRKEWFDVVALSISSPNQLISTTTLIADIRKLSSNKGILIMVGGPLALSVPDLATRAGADIVTLDARQAVDVAGRAVPVRGASVAN